MTSQEFRNYLAAGIVCQTLWPGAEETTAVQWDLLFEGAVETVVSDDGTRYCSVETYLDKSFSVEQGQYRLIVDNAAIYATISSPKATILIGNPYLYNNSNADTGDDFFVLISSLFGLTWSKFSLYSRDPGTYTVKIEKLIP